MRDREHALSVVRHHLDDIGRSGMLELRSERGRRPAYCVRFRVRHPETGVVSQRRLSIGDDPVLNGLVRTAISERVRGHLQAKAAKPAAAERRKRALADEAEFMAGHPGSRRHRQHVRRAYRASLASGQHFMVEMSRLLASLPRSKRPGRKFKSRLW